jgi:site-specific DNA-methyltransferase (adenine-specific)
MITMLNCDCMDYMATLPDKAFELAIVDPPYGIGRAGKPFSTSSHGGHKGFIDKKWDNEIPKQEYFDELFRVSKNQIIWGANYYPQFLKPSSGWILWDKGQRIDQADGELAFSSIDKPLRIFTLNRVSLLIEGTIHPTQKPVALYKWLLTRYAKPGDRILDTHGGSGSICIACHDLGFDLTWMELDADYYAAACKRYKDHAAQGVLFEPEKTQPKNAELFTGATDDRN